MGTRPRHEKACSISTHETTNQKNKGQSETGQEISDEDAQKYLAMAVTFSCAYSLEMLASSLCLENEITLEEEAAIDLGAYLMFVDAFASTDILTRLAASQRTFSKEELDAVAEHTNCYTFTAGALQYAIALLEQQEKSTEGLAEKILNRMQEYFSKTITDCMEGFFAIAAVFNPQYKIPNYDLLYRVVEDGLKRIYGENFREGATPYNLCHASYTEYIQAYFYPVRVSKEEEALAFTYRIYRDLFGEVFGFMACARLTMAELFTADEHMASVYEYGVASVFLQVLADRENEVFSMGLKDRGVPLSDLNLDHWDKKKIFRIPAPTLEEVGKMASQGLLDGFTGKK